MTISARVIADSIHPNGKRLTTFVLRYPRWLHSELMTHRALSRNASSSRAIPVSKFVAWVREEPAMPEVWFKNKPGMQGTEPMDAETIAKCQEVIEKMKLACIEGVEALSALGLHKQTANRYLEPWHHISVIVSATEMANMFSLRYHPMAEPHFEILARKMLQALERSEPKQLQIGEWHLPFVHPEEFGEHPVEHLLKFSVARCARVSFMNHNGTLPDPLKDVDLHDKLVVAKPLHASPAEHQAKMIDAPDDDNFDSFAERMRGNFCRGFAQYRKMLPDENILVMPELRPEDQAASVAS